MSVKEVKEYTRFLNVIVILNFISLASQRKGRNKPRLTVKETKYGLCQLTTYANSQHPVNCSAAHDTWPAPLKLSHGLKEQANNLCDLQHSPRPAA